MEQSPPESLGSILIRYHLIAQDELDEALLEQRSRGGRLGRILLDRGSLSEDALFWCLAHQLNIPCVTSISTDPAELDLEAIGMFSRELAWSHHMIPLLKEADTLSVVTDDPLDRAGIELVEHLLGMRLEVSVAPSSVVLAALRQLYPDTQDEVQHLKAIAPLEAWLKDCVGEGITRVRLEPTVNGAQVLFFQGSQPMPPRPLSAQRYSALMESLLEVTGGTPRGGAELRALKLAELEASVALARGHYGLVAVVHLEEREPRLDWPESTTALLQEHLSGPGLWLLAAGLAEEAETALAQLRCLFHGTPSCQGGLEITRAEGGQNRVMGRDELEAVIALLPPVLLLPGQMRAPIVEHLKGGLPACPVILHVPTRAPGAALQIMRSSGMSGPELAAQLRGVLCVFSLPSVMGIDSAGEGADPLVLAGPPRLALQAPLRARGRAPLLLDLYVSSLRLQRALVEEWGIASVAPLLTRGPLPALTTQIKYLREQGRLTGAEQDAYLESMARSRSPLQAAR